MGKKEAKNPKTAKTWKQKSPKSQKPVEQNPPEEPQIGHSHKSIQKQPQSD